MRWSAFVLCLGVTFAGAMAASDPVWATTSYVLGADSTEAAHSGGVPPEPSIAVGPTQLFVHSPGQVRILDKSNGSVLDNEAANIFFHTAACACTCAAW